MRTITIDIINEKALNLLRDMELLDLIRLRKDKTEPKQTSAKWAKYKGAMSKQPLSDIDTQIDELRNEWE
jgi:hypothetical protein